MTKSYGETAQAVYFKAARDLWKVACSVLDDFQNEVELRSYASLTWGKTTAAFYADKAREMENLGHERTIATPRAESDLLKAKAAYSNSVTGFMRRVEAASGTEMLAQVNAFKPAGT